MNTESTTLAAQAADASALEMHQREARRLVRLSWLVVGAGLLPALAWLAFAPLASAVVAGGFVKVDLDRRPVQHAEGGVVSEVLVRDGQRVRQGEPLLVLGDVAVDADRQRIAARVLSERASLARLDAEQRGAAAFDFPADVQETARHDAAVREHLDKERQLFDARRSALVDQVALIRSQQQGMAREMEALRAQIEQAAESLGHQAADVRTQRGLASEGFIAASRITQLDATIADYRVKLEERRGELARAEQRKVDGDLRIKALEGEYRQQASDQLKLASARLAELQQEQRKAADAAKRQVIVAPAEGDVINLRFTSPGAVVAPRESIADIVPSLAPLMIEARLRTEDVSRVHTGQGADIRFTAFAYRSTRLVGGQIRYVSPDRLVDRNTNQAYYVTLIEVDHTSLAAQPDIKLQAGMPAEVFIRGEERTPLSYLVEPVTNVLRRAGRES